MAAGPAGVYGALDVGSYSSGGYSPTAITFSGGFKVAPNIAAEIGYVSASDYTYNIFGNTYTYSQSVFKGAGVASFPVAPQIEAFGKLGLAMVRWSSGTPFGSTSGTQTNLMFGFGGQYNINKQVAARAQYESFGSGVSMISVGGVYNF